MEKTEKEKQIEEVFKKIENKEKSVNLGYLNFTKQQLEELSNLLNENSHILQITIKSLKLN